MESIEVIVTPPKKVVSVKLDVDIIEQMDKVWREYGYSSRSEFIREAILFYMMYLSQRKARKRAEADDDAVKEVIRELESLLDELEV